MCTAPKIPPPPPPPQQAQTPDTASAFKAARQAAGFGNGTILTGAQGVGAGALNTGTNTLLGG